VSICIAAGGTTAKLAVAAFTLAWTHSVEHVRWEEDWLVAPDGLHLVEARVRGSGAGMEPGPDARLEDGWWRWHPEQPALPELLLAASGATGGGWSLCAANACRELGAEAGAPIRLAACG
jgi:hypothetical protein